MAIGRLSVKVGKAGKASPHAAYIARIGQYEKRLERGEKLEASEFGNMPKWAASNPLQFWEAADANERKNGTTYREFEIALPREMNPAQRLELVRDFVEQEIGDRHAYQFAIHTPTAADGGEQPHAHVMFSERQVDGIDRDPEQYFKRYNSKNPERGGAKKGYGESAGQTLSRSERADELKALRGRWEEMCNAHLDRASIEARIDMRSHAERGTGLAPEVKQLPSQWRDPQQRANVIDFREARREQQAANENLSREIPDAGAEIVSLSAVRERRAEQAKETDAAELVKEWTDTKKEMVRSRSQRAEALSGRIYGEVEQIGRERFRRRQEHMKTRPQEPTGMLATFKRKAYAEALAVWDKGMKAIDQWKQGREQTLRQRFKQLRDYVVGGHKVGAAVDRKMQRERPEDARTVAQYERKQIEARHERQKQRQRDRGNDRGGIEL
ncbi:MobA/MobL family protein [Salmonella enterica subsp. enterica serovar Heidelberg]|nr:MobA/MobL family protein [Salmonella enterica subsp. enterica serovar Heidelberg]EHH3095819.1 MobA/MobL family protein [Salmonella enterica]EJB1919225.1 MobA/MobL family protein [Salmonella enterica]